MKERPIIFSTELIPKILDGTKTQTRRVIKPQPICDSSICKESNYRSQILNWIGDKDEGREHWFCYTCGHGLIHIDEWSSRGFFCPYGQVGDRLWVRETGVWDKEFVAYKANMPDVKAKWQSPIFMPRWASRITLEITALKAERLQEITSADLAHEGIYSLQQKVELRGFAPMTVFRNLWNSLNAKRVWKSDMGSITGRGYSWESNPFVWVIEFKLLQ